MKRIVYTSGPMAGHPALNEPAFRAAEHTTWEAGAEPLTPHDLMPQRQGWGVWRASRRPLRERCDHKRHDAMLKKATSKGVGK